MSESKFEFGPFLERKYKQLFNRLDFQKNGKLTEEDAFAVALRAKEKNNLTDEQANSMKDQFSALFRAFFNSDGLEATSDDFVKNSKAMTLEQIEKGATGFYSMLFDAVDVNKNGLISLKEFLDWCDLLDVGRVTGAETFKLIDENKDGNISREEFLNFARRYATSNDETDVSKQLLGPLTA